MQADLIQIFEDYLKVASDAFRRTQPPGNGDESKKYRSRLETSPAPVGSPRFSFLVNARSGCPGEHQGEALSYLARDMDISKEALEKTSGQSAAPGENASIPLWPLR